MSLQITHIRKPNPQSSHEAISHYGVTSTDGTLKVYEREWLVKWLKDNDTQAYVANGSGKVFCEARYNGHVNYLQTKADGVWTDNLLSLPQC
jgi:hypothetical protein